MSYWVQMLQLGINFLWCSGANINLVAVISCRPFAIYTQPSGIEFMRSVYSATEHTGSSVVSVSNKVVAYGGCILVDVFLVSTRHPHKGTMEVRANAAFNTHVDFYSYLTNS